MVRFVNMTSKMSESGYELISIRAQSVLMNMKLG